jgi:glucose-1-phosphate thymidylyltransferase
MKLLLLAAGYATRLYPLTRTKAKPLLEIGGRPIIEHVLATTTELTGIDHTFIVTNEKFAADFQHWAAGYRTAHPHSPPITIVNDHSTDESNKLGAIGDIHLVIRQHNINDDLLIIGGDNLFKESLAAFVHFARTHGPTVGVHDLGDLQQMKQYGNVTTDESGRITRFEEKPDHPHSTLAAMCLYYYPRTTLPLIEQYATAGHNLDQPGRLIGWLCQRIPVFAYQIHGPWLDIGTFETLAEANRLFA